MKIGKLENNAVVDGKTDYYTYETVDDVVDLDVSGKDYNLQRPYLIIRLEKTEKIELEKVLLLESQSAISTERGDDGKYISVKYTYNTLSGGYHNTYPISFNFDGKHAVNGDTVKLEATLYENTGKKVTHAERTYTAKTIGFRPYSRHGASNLGGSVFDTHKGEKIPKDNPDKLESDGHRNEYPAIVDSMDTNLAPKGSIPMTNLFLSVAVKPEGQPGIQGLMDPKNIKIVATFPKGIIFLILIRKIKNTPVKN